MAGEAGIRVSDHALHVVHGKSILIVERFDRVATTRIGYVSALTMLDRADAEPGSYLEIADAVVRHSPAATEDLRELRLKPAQAIDALAQVHAAVGRWREIGAALGASDDALEQMAPAFEHDAAAAAAAAAESFA